MIEEGNLSIRTAMGDTLRVVVAGDTCFRMGVASEDVRNGRAGEILRGVAPFLNDADLRVVQWEMVLTEAETPIDKSGPNLKAPPFCTEFATAAGFDVALLANNHAGDYGPDAALETRDHLRRVGVATVGLGANLAEAVQPLSIERAGFRIGIINVAENEFGLARPNRAGGAPLDLPANLRAIRRAKRENDLVLMFLHGGNEHFPLPSPRIVDTCRAYVDAGADAVVCIHTHCPQGLEVYEGVPIVYCPGNFFFSREDHQDLESFLWIGYLPKITFDRKGATSIELLPYRLFPNPWRIEKFAKPQEDAFLRYLARISELIGEPAELQRLFEAWAAKHGLPFLQKLCAGEAYRWPDNLQDREQVKTILSLRNMLTCEAHHSVLCAVMRLIEEYRLEAALAAWPEIEALQSTAFLNV